MLKHFAAATLLMAAAAGVADASPGNCAELDQLALPDIHIREAAASTGEEAEDARPLPDGVPSRQRKAVVPHCKVEGTIGDEINFELLLPDEWNGKFMMGGGGGYVGSVQNQARHSVNRGYATVATDTGHQANGIRADWAHNHLERQVNWGYLAVHRTAEAAKAIIRAYYESAPKYSYFNGCSNGGRQALMEAQRFPDDFDGIISGAPAHDFSGLLAAFLYNVQRIFPDRSNPTESVITPDNRRLLQSTILEQCDRLDGVEDGILDDPRECAFKLSSLPKCPGGRPAAHCLTVVQQEAIAAVYDGPRNQDGQIHPGFPFGGENEADWQGWITGPSTRMIEAFGEPTLQFGFGTQGFKHLIFRDPEFDYTRYDFATFASDGELFSSFADATDPDLSEFKKAGGKLILWHGWADAALTALASVDYFEAAESHDADLRDYFRFYMLPGVFHCAGGPGPDRVDWIDAIENWVERHEAPERLTAYRVSDKQVDMTRPLCVFPQRAVYKGSGSTDEAVNFECRDPEGQ